MPTTSAKFNARGTTFTPPPGASLYVAGAQSEYDIEDAKAGVWKIAVAAGATVDVATWWYSFTNRNTAVVYQVVDGPVTNAGGVVTIPPGSTVKATVTIDQEGPHNDELDPQRAAIAAALMYFTGTTGTGSAGADQNATNNAGGSVPYPILWTGVCATGTLSVVISSATAGPAAQVIADTVLVRSSLPFPPAATATLTVGMWGKMVFAEIVDAFGVPAIPTAISTNLQVSVNGGPFTTLGNPIRCLASESGQDIPVPFFAFPLSPAVGPTDTVIGKAPDGWASVAAGNIASFAALAAVNSVGTPLVGRTIAPANLKRVGYNLEQPSYYNPVPSHANFCKQMSVYTGTSFTLDGDANVIAGSCSALVTTPAPNVIPGSESRGYPGSPTSGVATLSWTGSGNASAGLNNGTSTPGAPNVSGSGDTQTNSITYTFAVTDGSWQANWTLAVDATLGKVISPSLTFDSCPAEATYNTFSQKFVDMLGNAQIVRAANAIGIDNSNNASTGANLADFSQPTAATYCPPLQPSYKQWTGCVLNPYTDTIGYFDARAFSGGSDNNQATITVTTPVAHGLTTGQPVTMSRALFTYADASTRDSAVWGYGYYPVLVIDATHFAIIIPGSPTSGTIATGSVYPGTIAFGLAGGWPIRDLARLCGLKSGRDLHQNIPHSMPDTEIFKLGQYLADSMPAGSRVRVQWSNEIWNSSFSQYYYVNGQAILSYSSGNPLGLSATWETRRHQWGAWRSATAYTAFINGFVSHGRSAADVVQIFALWSYSPATTTTIASFLAGGGYVDPRSPVTFAMTGYFTGAGPYTTANGAVYDALDDDQINDVWQMTTKHIHQDNTQGNVGYSAHIGAFRAYFPNAKPVLYECGPGFSTFPTALPLSSAQLAVRSQHALVHPGFYWIQRSYLQFWDDSGLTAANLFTIGLTYQQVAVPQDAEYSTFISWNGRRGTANNVAQLDNYPALQSPKAQAVYDWIAASSGGIPPYLFDFLCRPMGI